MIRTLVEVRGAAQPTFRLLVKGALEVILRGCARQIAFDGVRSALTPSEEEESLMRETALESEKIHQKAEELMRDSYRLVGLAFRDFRNREEALKAFDKFEGWVFIGFIGLRDEVRPEVRESIRLCRKAGIRVIMVTGDNVETAKAVARECGIMRREPAHSMNEESEETQEVVMEGEEFIRRVGGLKQRVDEDGNPVDGEFVLRNPYEFDKFSEDLVVLARARPVDKQVLTVGFKNQGNVVAVTGDGTNDCLALKWADVGFAMGQNGTEIALQASDIVILDDSFNSILQAVLWGRNIYDSIRKFLQFQLAVNISAIVCTLIGALIYRQALLTPIQLLWINLIMDSLAALALATDTPSHDLLNRHPHGREEYIINRTMVRNILAQSILQISVILVIVVFGHRFLPEGPDATFDALIEAKYQDYQTRKLAWPEYLTPLWRVRYSNEDLTHLATGILFEPNLSGEK